MNINEKHHIFAKARANGADNKEAAIEAGYSASSAAQQGSRLAREPEIKALIAKYSKQAPPEKPAVELNLHESNVTGFGVGAVQNRYIENHADEGDASPLDAIKTEDPLQFLIGAMNCSGLDDGKRIDAAKAALPYKHGKIGEKGKKEGQNDTANGITQESNRFGTRKRNQIH